MGRAVALMLLIAAALAGCCFTPTRRALAALDPVGDRDQSIVVIRRQWHIELAFPASELTPSLGPVVMQGSRARYLGFGFGDRNYLLGGSSRRAGAIAALWPRPGLIRVQTLDGSPQQAFGAGQVITLAVTRTQSRQAQEFIRDSLLAGAVIAAAPASRSDGESQYFEALPRYSLNFTCNTWAAQVLAAAGLPVRTRGVVLAGQLWSQLLNDRVDWTHQNTAPPSTNSAE